MAAPDFIDECRISVQAGNGGQGCASFRREKFVPRGGPDGGNGGRGGSVILEGSAGLSTLYDARHRKSYRARNGARGAGARKNGASGPDVVLRLPLGTVIRADSGELLHELLRNEEQFVAARGGRGGRGNASFASSTKQSPHNADPGEPGEGCWLRLELKLLADVGLLGFPNAGKSTLIARVSAARPRVASYPFTTLRPQLGAVEHGEARFVMADIPGLIPGAHLGAGLGDRFLRHVERTRVLVHLLDPEPSVSGGSPERSPERDYAALRAELRAYAEELAGRPEIVCVTKADLVPKPADRKRIEALLEAHSLTPHWLSSVTGEGVRELVQRLAAEVGRA